MVNAPLRSCPRGIEWAAGLFEGEGCITRHHPTRPQLKLTLKMTDEDAVREFARIVGGPVYGPYNNGNGRKNHWEWTVVTKQAREVLDRLLPYLMSRRAARAEELMGIWRTNH